MSIFRKTEDGRLVKTAGYLVQRWNDQIFTTTHSVVDNKDFYDIDPMASKFITGLTDFTEFQLYINEPNITDNVFIRYAGKTLELKRSSNDDIGIGTLHRRVNVYTLGDGVMWMDSKLQPTPDNYKGIFTYAVVEFTSDIITQPSPGQTLLELSTNKIYEYDGNEWDEVDTIAIVANGWYWMIEFFPDYYFGNGKVVWNGGTEQWDIYTARTARPDEVNIVTDPVTNTFSTKSDGDGTKYLSDDGIYKEISGGTPSRIQNAGNTQFVDTQANDVAVDLSPSLSQGSGSETGRIKVARNFFELYAERIYANPNLKYRYHLTTKDNGSVEIVVEDTDQLYGKGKETYSFDFVGENADRVTRVKELQDTVDTIANMLGVL